MEGLIAPRPWNVTDFDLFKECNRVQNTQADRVVQLQPKAKRKKQKQKKSNTALRERITECVTDRPNDGATKE